MLKRAMMRKLGAFYPDSACATCGHYVNAGDHKVTIHRKVKDGQVTASYSGLTRCKDDKLCPNCAQVSASQDADDLRACLQGAYAKLLQPVMATFTFSHQRGTPYAEVRSRFRQALADMRSGRAWADLRKRYGLQGFYAGEEETYGENGWHPHEHDLMVVGRFADLDAFADDLYELYAAALARQGLTASRGRGLQVDASREGVAEYVTKRGAEDRWDAPAEAAGSTSKRGRKGRTVWQLLEDATLGDDQAAALFCEYADYWLGSGRRRSAWSPGFYRRMLGYNRGEEPDYVRDAMALTRLIERGRIVMSLDVLEWLAVRKHRAEAVLLWLATIWDAGRLRRYVDALVAHGASLDGQAVAA